MPLLSLREFARLGTVTAFLGLASVLCQEAVASHARTIPTILAQKKPAQVPFGHESNVLYASFSPDGKMLAFIGEKGGIRIWDIANKKEIQRVSSELHAEFVFSPDGKTIAVGDLNGASLLEIGPNPKTRLVLKSRFVRWVGDLQRGTEITSLHFSADGKQLVAADYTGEVTLIDVKTGAATCIREGTPGALLAFNCLVRISPDGKRIAHTSQEGLIRTWDNVEKKRAAAFSGHSDKITSFQFSSDGDLLVSASFDGTVRVWDCRKDKQISILQIAAVKGESDGCCAAISPSKKEIVTGEQNGLIKIWDLQSGKIIRQMQGPASGIMDVKYHPDGNYLISTGEEHAVRFWDARTGAPRMP